MKEKYQGREQVHTANGQGMNISHVGHTIVNSPSKGREQIIATVLKKKDVEIYSLLGQTPKRILPFFFSSTAEKPSSLFFRPSNRSSTRSTHRGRTLT
jgi:hypothetical protein